MVFQFFFITYKKLLKLEIFNRYSHPREEHLIPLMVVAGAAAGGKGKKIWEDYYMSFKASAFIFE